MSALSRIVHGPPNWKRGSRAPLFMRAAWVFLACGTTFVAGLPALAKDPREAVRLNNLVIEHVNATMTFPVASRRAKPLKKFSFETRREGWVFISLSVTGPEVRICLDSEDPAAAVLVADRAAGVPFETMRFVPKGRHEISVFKSEGKGSGRLIVRTVPAMMLFPVSFAAWEKETGGHNYADRKDWEFFKKFMLQDCNIVVFYNAEDFQPYIEECRRAGKKSLVKRNVPYFGSTPDQIFEVWGGPLIKFPNVDGITIDEFGPGKEYQRLYSTWIGVFDRIARDPRCRGKKIYSYWGSSAPREEMRALVEATRRHNFRWLHEGYYMLRKSEGDEAGQLRYITAWGGSKFEQFQKMFPGLVENNLFYIFGISNYHWSFDLSPELDFKVFLDLQFHHVVNHPGFKDMYGVGLYTLNHSTEEICRYASALVRHYCIEGSRTRFNRDLLELRHIKNPGFEEGTKNWEIQPAAPNSVEALEVGRLPYKNTVTDRAIPEGRTVLCTTRHAGAPNVISQKIAHVTPGRFYSVRVMVSDLTDPATTKLVPISIRIPGARELEGRRMDRPWTTKFTRNNGEGKVTACWNFRFRVFCAEGREATLILSDWPAERAPGGDVGHRVIWDFIEVQPYYLPQPQQPGR